MSMNLKAYLATINVTLKDFGEYIEATPRYLSQISRGRILPGERLAVTFDLSKKKKKIRTRKPMKNCVCQSASRCIDVK
jgi:hypothetical protein